MNITTLKSVSSNLKDYNYYVTLFEVTNASVYISINKGDISEGVDSGILGYKGKNCYIMCWGFSKEHDYKIYDSVSTETLNRFDNILTQYKAKYEPLQMQLDEMRNPQLKIERLEKEIQSLKTECDRQYNILHKECYDWKSQYHSVCNELSELRIRESVLSFLLHQPRKNWSNKLIVISEDGEYYLATGYDKYTERCLGVVSEYL